MRKNRGYWTKERCLKEAVKYKLRSMFKANSGGAYNASIKNGWLDEICSHMSVVGNRFMRLVYVYEFDDGAVYVGLTYNIEKRDNKHKRDKRSKVYQHIKKTGFKPILTYSDYIDVNKARVLEAEKVEEYRNSGYNVLNEAKAGAIGGGLKWNKKKCLQESLKYKKRTIFAKESGSAYNSARINGWLDEICSHMNVIEKKPKSYWTKERCEKEVVKYNSKKELYKKSPGAYMSMLNNNWLHELCPHMRTKKSNGYWTKEKCLEEALRYNSKQEFRKNNESAYVIALKNKWLIEVNFEIKIK